ncbi:MAG: hypothetical protein JWO72_934 [Caulobacteraceae bacterium]|nr:hypothetical protein [Caulobacteraceae bacterium]
MSAPSADKPATALRSLGAPRGTQARINPALSFWLDEKRRSRQVESAISDSNDTHFIIKLDSRREGQ